MDPLSITCSAIAILGAINATRKCVDKIRAMRKAPAQLAELCEEIEEFHTTLCQVSVVTSTIEADEQSRIQHAEALVGLDRFVQRATGKLEKLDRLIPASFDHDDPNNKYGAKKLDLWSWAKRSGKAAKLRDDLRGIQLSMIIGLAAITSSTNLKTQHALEQVAEAVGLQSRWDIGNTTNVLQINIKQPTAQSPEDSETPPPRYPEKESNGDMTRRLPTVLADSAVVAVDKGPSNSAVVVQSPTPEVNMVLPRNTCSAWCSCRCHRRTCFSSTGSLDVLLGSISTDSHGMIKAIPACNEHSCRRKTSQGSLRVTYRPPKWLSNHLLQFSVRLSPVRGPEINVKLPRMVGWYNPLWKMACEGDIDGIRKLYTSGAASPWDVNPLGGSVLHYAAERRNWDLCSLLLQNGATQSLEDELGGDPMAMAWGLIFSGNLSDNEVSRTKLLFDGEEHIESRQFSVLHKIVLGLIDRDLKSMLELSTAEIDRTDASGRTCVSWAATRGDHETLRTLLEFGADPNVADNRGLAPLSHVKGTDCCKLLLEHSALVTARDKTGKTAIHWNCRERGDVHVLETLLQAGTDMNARDKDNETALANAVLNGFTDCAHQLLNENADIRPANNGGDDVVRLAIANNSHSILERLLKHPDCSLASTNASGHTMAHTIARNADARTLELLSDKKLDPKTLTLADSEGHLPASLLEGRVDEDDIADLREAFTNMFIAEPKHEIFVDAVEIFDDHVDEILV